MIEQLGYIAAVAGGVALFCGLGYVVVSIGYDTARFVARKLQGLWRRRPVALVERRHG